jgi:hypothetical protein
MSNTDPHSLEGVFMSMVHTHNESALNLRLMYRMMIEQGCDLPINFSAPDATWEEPEVEQHDPARPMFGLQRNVAPSESAPAVERQEGTVFGPVTETLASGIVVTTLAQTKDGKPVVAERRGEERTGRAQIDAEDVEVRDVPTGTSLEQLRKVVESIDAEPEPTIPTDFSLAAANKVEVTPVVKVNFKQSMQDLLREYVSTTVFADGKGKWEPRDTYTDEALTAPPGFLINWPSGFYRGHGGNAIVINIDDKVTFVFGKNYQTRNIEATDACFVVIRSDDNDVAVLNENSPEDSVAVYVPHLKTVLESFFKRDQITDEE